MRFVIVLLLTVITTATATAQSKGALTPSIEAILKSSKAAANIRKAALNDVVTVVHGDAFLEIPKLQGTFDLVFLDAWKPDYKKFFDIVFPRVAPGGLFLAHNVINKKNEMGDFLQAIHSHPAAYTTTVSPGREGISMTYKTR